MVSDIGIYRGHQIFYGASRKEIGLTPAEFTTLDQAEADTVSPDQACRQAENPAMDETGREDGT